MPYKGPVKRIENYRDKLSGTRVKEDIDQKRERMIAAQQEATNALVQVELAVRAVLADEDEVESLEFVWYYDFGRKIFKVTSQIGGGKPMNREVWRQVDYWEARRCNRRVLLRILAEVFSLPLPPGEDAAKLRKT
jgi:hypothetical protein